MKKVFRLDELDCANCAAKMERAIRKIDGVISADISFMSQKLSIEAADSSFDGVMDEVKRVCKRIEPDCKIIG